MKKLLFFATLVVSFTAQAGDVYCSNGDIDTVGDAYHLVVLKNDVVEVYPYESSFTLDLSKAVRKGKTISFVNQKVEYTSEGDSQMAVMDVVINYDEQAKTMEFDWTMDSEFRSKLFLTCETSNP